MRILQIITSLSSGGAEIMLQKLVHALKAQRYSASVVSLTEVARIGTELRMEGTSVLGLGGRGGVLLPHQVWALLRAYKNIRPDVVHSWMYHANVAAHILLNLSARKPRPGFITSVRGAIHAPREQKATLRVVRGIDARLSHRADAIIFNSRRAAEQHTALGYDARKITVIPNCFDTNQFRPMPAERARIRAELRCADSTLVGLVARFDHLKGHRTFLEAAKLVSVRSPQCKFLLAGRGCDSRNQELIRFGPDLHL